MKLLVFLHCIIPVLSFGQIAAVDFEDNDLTGWYQNIESRWHITADNPINGGYSLKHAYDNPTAGCDWITFLHKPIDFYKATITWEFSVCYDHNPSSSNNWAVFLSMSDIPEDLNKIEDALIFGVNYQGNNDALAFWKQNGTDIECLYSTGYNWEENIDPRQKVKILIQKLISGSIQISIKIEDKEYQLIGSTESIKIDYSSSFLIYYKYSSTYDRGLAIDDIKITGDTVKDKNPPEMKEIRVLSPQKLEVEFNEIIKILGENNFCVDGIGCRQVDRNVGSKFTINLPYPLTPGENYLLKIPLVSDLSGNINSSAQKMFYYPKACDIIINEIMADPDSAVLLPEYEFIELYNRSENYINLHEWHLSANNKKILIPSISLNPGEYIAVCKSEGASLFNPELKIFGIKDFPVINNDACEIILSDVSDHTIHSVNYSDRWITSSEKKDGGWSVEMINSDEPCMELGNWKESSDYTGGTPGKQNSVYNINVNNYKPELYRAAIKDNHYLMLYFSEPLDSNSIINPSYFNVDRGIGNPDSIMPYPHQFDKLCLYFKNDFLPDLDYTISLTSDIIDCSGKTFSRNQKLSFRMPEIASWSDVVINEIMYDPLDGEPEYIELYNHSSKTIDLKDWSIVIGDSTKEKKIITEDLFLVSPRSYLIVCSELASNLRMNEIEYRKNIILNPKLPALSNEGNCLYLFDSQNQLIDKAVYSPEFHNNLIVESKGVSLERISAEKPGDDRNNWQSASTDEGYKTPACRNSQQNEINQSNELNFSPNTITPNSDGIDDVLNITYSLENTGYMGRVLIFDIDGNLQSSILNSGLLGTDGNFTFNGVNDNGKLLPTGFYILYFEALSADGRVYKEKKTFIIAN